MKKYKAQESLSRDATKYGARKNAGVGSDAKQTGNQHRLSKVTPMTERSAPAEAQRVPPPYHGATAHNSDSTPVKTRPTTRVYPDRLVAELTDELRAEFGASAAKTAAMTVVVDAPSRPAAIAPTTKTLTSTEFKKKSLHPVTAVVKKKVAKSADPELTDDSDDEIGLAPLPDLELPEDYVDDFEDQVMVEETAQAEAPIDLAGTEDSDELFGSLQDMNLPEKKVPWTGSDKQRTIVWWYLQEVSKHGLLSAQDEIELGRQIQAGSEEALSRLVAGNLRLVVSIAKRYMRQGMDFEDVIQEGNLGLMLAAKKFDPAMGNKFTTYATWWIRQSITRALSNKSRIIRLPVHVNEMLFKLKRAAKPFYQRMGRPPTVLELCQSTGLAEADVDHVLKSSVNTLSIDDFIKGGEDETLEKFIEDKGIPRPEEYAERELLSRKVRKLMNALETEESSVLTPLYGLDGRARRSAKEVASSLGIEVRDVRRIEIRALRRLRRATHNRQLVDFLADA